MYAWTLTTYHETNVYYDYQRGLLRHGKERLSEWSPVYLLSPDGKHGLLLPVCDEALDLVLPVRIRSAGESKCNLLSAQIDQEEKFYCARPEHSELSSTVVALENHASLWETLYRQLASPPVDLGEMDLKAFTDLVKKWPSPEHLLRSTASGRATRWFLAMQRPAYLDKLGHVAVEEPGHGFLRTLAASAFQPAMRSAYGSLAEWLEDRDGSPPIDHLGKSFNILDFYPTELPFILEFEINARIRRAVEPRKRFCVVATVRNEGPYIVEWLSYYKALGFEHFFVYTNENDDGSNNLLNELARKNYITLIVNDATQARPQFKAYGHALKALPHLLDYEWALFIDADEFLVFDAARFINIASYTDWLSIRPVDAVAINWYIFRSFGIEHADFDTPVTRRFHRRLSGVDHHVKSMFRPRCYYHAHAHYPFEARGILTRFLDANGDDYEHLVEKAHNRRPVVDVAWINHYWSRSDEEFCLKQARNGGDLRSTIRRSPVEILTMLEEMRHEDSQQEHVDDRRIISFAVAGDNIAAEILADPDIYAAHHVTVDRQKRSRDELMKSVRPSSSPPL